MWGRPDEGDQVAPDQAEQGESSSDILVRAAGQAGLLSLGPGGGWSPTTELAHGPRCEWPRASGTGSQACRSCVCVRHDSLHFDFLSRPHVHGQVLAPARGLGSACPLPRPQCPIPRALPPPLTSLTSSDSTFHATVWGCRWGGVRALSRVGGGREVTEVTSFSFPPLANRKCAM